MTSLRSVADMPEVTLELFLFFFTKTRCRSSHVFGLLFFVLLGGKETATVIVAVHQGVGTELVKASLTVDEKPLLPPLFPVMGASK